MAKKKCFMPGVYYLGERCRLEEGQWSGKPDELRYMCRAGDDRWYNLTEWELRECGNRPVKALECSFFERR